MWKKEWKLLPSNKDFWSPVSSLKTIPVTENLMGFLCSKQQVTQLGLLSREGKGEGALWLHAVCPCETSPDKDRISPVAFPQVKHLIILLHTCQLCPAQGAVSRWGSANTTAPSTERDTVLTQGMALWPFICHHIWLCSLSCNEVNRQWIDRQTDRQTKTCSLPQQYLPRQP